MNRINTIIDNHATMESMCFHRAVLLGRDGFIEESAGMTKRMIEAHEQLKMWMKISQAIRGWHNCDMDRI